VNEKDTQEQEQANNGAQATTGPKPPTHENQEREHVTSSAESVLLAHQKVFQAQPDQENTYFLRQLLSGAESKIHRLLPFRFFKCFTY